MARTQVGTSAPGGTDNGSERDPGPRIARQAALPSGRAAVGGLLMAVAAGGVLVAYQSADSGPSGRVVVVSEDVTAGEVFEEGLLEVVEADLPAGADGVFTSVDSLVGRVSLQPLDEGDIVQQSAVGRTPRPAVAHEVALTLPREQVAVGRLRRGESVDVYVTSEELTTSVVRGAEVLQLDEDGDGSLTSEREVTVVVGVSSADAVAALVHALRTGDVTVVRTAEPGSDQVAAFPSHSDEADGPGESDG